MIIASWNVFKGTTEKRADELNKIYDADIIAFQETGFSADALSAWCGEPDKSRKGVSVWSRYDFEVVKPAIPCSPSMGIRIDKSPIGPLNILNLWAKPNPDYFSDLMNSLEAYDSFIKSGPSIILGDFNISPKIKGKADKFNTFNAHLETEYNLASTYHLFTHEPFGGETQTTLYFRWNEAATYHCDFIYLPKAFTGFIKSVVIPPYQDLDTSDHRPVICKIETG